MENGVSKFCHCLCRRKNGIRTLCRTVCRSERAAFTGLHSVCRPEKASPGVLTPFAVRKMNIRKIMELFSIRPECFLKTCAPFSIRPTNPRIMHALFSIRKERAEAVVWFPSFRQMVYRNFGVLFSNGQMVLENFPTLFSRCRRVFKACNANYSDYRAGRLKVEHANSGILIGFE